MVRLQRCAIATRVGERLRQVGELLRHLRLRQEILLLREAARAARIGQRVAFGDADARFVRAKIVAPSGTGSDASRRSARRRWSRERNGRLHQRFVVGVARALHFEHVALRKARQPIRLASRFAAVDVALQQRLPDVAVARARQAR